jgi:hypothetical protein
MKKDKLNELEALKLRILSEQFTRTYIEDEAFQYLN